MSKKGIPPLFHKDEFGIDLFEKLVEHLWEKRHLLKDDNFYFDYPDYGDLPYSIWSNLSSYAVDLIQEVFSPNASKSGWWRTKKQLREELLCRFFVLSQSI